MHQVRFLDTGETLSCGEGYSLLQSMERLGRKGIPVGCRNGGCGVCKIRVVEGAVDRRVMSRAHVSAEEEAGGFALACRITPRSDLAIHVVGKMRTAFAEILEGKGS
jgi:ferredoxin